MFPDMVGIYFFLQEVTYCFSISLNTIDHCAFPDDKQFSQNFAVIIFSYLKTIKIKILKHKLMLSLMFRSALSCI